MKKTLPVKPGSSKKEAGNTKPIDEKHEVQQSNDEHIDQDFPGFPHPPSTEAAIVKKKKTTAKR